MPCIALRFLYCRPKRARNHACGVWKEFTETSGKGLIPIIQGTDPSDR